jgi:hypothetical protein
MGIFIFHIDFAIALTNGEGSHQPRMGYAIIPIRSAKQPEANRQMVIELKGHIGADGKIMLHSQTALPEGDVDIVIVYADEASEQDEAEWDAQFKATPNSVFESLIAQGLANYQSGLTDEFDPNIEDD